MHFYLLFQNLLNALTIGLCLNLHKRKGAKNWLTLCNPFTPMSLKLLMNVFRVISPSKLLTALIFFQSTNCFADYQTLFQGLVEQKQAQIQLLEHERKSPELLQEQFEQRKAELNLKLKELQAQLDIILKQIAELDKEMQAIAEHQEMPRKDLVEADWDQLLDVNEIGKCRLKARDKEGYYEIYHSNGEAIRFKPFKETAKESSSFALMIGTVENPGVEVTQPGYKINGSKVVNMEAKLQYTIKDNNLIYGHVGILGERIKDRTFGGSTHKPRRLICNTGFTPLN